MTTITQTISLPCTPQVAFDAWLDSKQHSAMINATATIEPHVGDKFSIWDGYFVGATKEIDHKKLRIVQSWRDTEANWPAGHYSTITLTFAPADNPKTCMLHFTHTDIPADAKAYEAGWHEYYWEPMKEYFSEISNS